MGRRARTRQTRTLHSGRPAVGPYHESAHPIFPPPQPSANAPRETRGAPNPEGRCVLATYSAVVVLPDVLPDEELPPVEAEAVAEVTWLVPLPSCVVLTE